MTAPGPPEHRPRWARRILLFLLAAIAWTGISSYPNPAVLYRNLARYRRLPIDAAIEQRMQWDLPDRAPAIEAFVNSLLVPTPDWALYRVPWYVPTAVEAANALHGDCEARAILLASLLAGKDLPFEIRASFNHIWVDYPGRRPRPGEAQQLAYLEGEPGRLRLHWPSQVNWREVLAIQREQLWDAMPLARKAAWLLGLLWVGLAALSLGSAPLSGDFASDWRLRARPFLGRAVWLALLLFVIIAVTPALRRGAPVRWCFADLYEVIALSALTGVFLTWISIPHTRLASALADDRSQIRVLSSLGPWTTDRGIGADAIIHFDLEVPSGPLRPWSLFAALRTGERVLLARHHEEVAARAALRRLGLSLSRPVIVRSDDTEYRTMPDQITLSLRERAARGGPPAPADGQPASSQPSEKPPAGCDLTVIPDAGRCTIAYPTVERKAGRVLAALALFPVGLVILATVFLLIAPWIILLWAGWIVATSLLSLTIYLALILRSELLARLGGARVEIGGSDLTFRTADGRAESVPLGEIEAVEISRQGEAPSLSIISPHRVIHLRGLCDPSHLPWLRQTIEHAIITTGQT